MSAFSNASYVLGLLDVVATLQSETDADTYVA